MKKKTPSVNSKKKKTRGKDMLEACNVSPWYSVGKILPTSTKLKEDVFDSYRPNFKCVDYKISETWAKMQKGDVKVNYRETTAVYQAIPVEICERQRKKKSKYFSGGPPQWKFIDEILREQMEKWQEYLRKEHAIAARSARMTRAKRLKTEHEAVQQLIGPEWFMELSPKQLQAAEQLRQSIFLDLRNNTTENCYDILAALGLVLRPSKKHIATALKHCCMCPVEFLLVLYQIMNPNRKSYSLNDRLLLSAVAHLSITHTLRELHVRIPSPPKVTKKVEKPKKKVNRVEYESPYLEPLVYRPPPPKFSGTYTNKHKQYPESPYFSYLESFHTEKRSSSFCVNYSIADEVAVKEYQEAQDFFHSLPGVKEDMLTLLYPSKMRTCRNLLHPGRATFTKTKFIAPRLCKVTPSEPIICFCEENLRKQNPNFKKLKRSCCEKAAQKFLQSACICDDCLEHAAQKSVVRIYGGIQKSSCKCDDPVPIIQGTLLNRTCECYKDYRNKIVGSAARQYLRDQQYKYVVAGVVMTKLGPVYNVLTTLGEKICLCVEIQQRKMRVKQMQETLCNYEAKFAIGGVTLSKIGPVYNLTAVVARTPCKCLIKYMAQLKILEIQNNVRRNRNTFVNHGLISGKQGPVFQISSLVPGAMKTSPEVCSCEIKRPSCLQRCLDYFDYTVSVHTPSSDESQCSSETSESGSGEVSSSDQSGSAEATCGSGNKKTKLQTNGLQKQSCENCQDSSNLESECLCDELESSEELESSSNVEKDSSSEHTTTSTTKSSDSEDLLAPKECRCKDELERFMKAKCPCEECNNKIRQLSANYVMGGTKMTPSGNQINVVQAVQQPVCGCLHEHQVKIKKIDEYKSRAKARYDLKNHQKNIVFLELKILQTKIGKLGSNAELTIGLGTISYLSVPNFIKFRPPIDCECAKAIREKEEQEQFEKQRAKMINTGRIKYEIAGVKAMPDENVYIVSRAINTPECECTYLLTKFEQAHRPCMQEFEQYLEQTENEIKDFDEDDGALEGRRDTLLSVGDIGFEVERSQTNVNSEQDPTVPVPVLVDDNTYLEEITEESEVALETPKFQPPETKQESQTEESQHESQIEETSSTQSKNSKCLCNEESSESEDDAASADETSPDSESSLSESSSSNSDDSECGSCHVEIPPEVQPITLPSDKDMPESFLSRRFAIFKEFPKDRKIQMVILQHILEGMAEDGFPLAKLPQVYKLPIFRLWLQMRSGVNWNYEDRLRYYAKSKDLWGHTMMCYKVPRTGRMPYTINEAQAMTWKDANIIKSLAAEKMNRFYRKVKQETVDNGREFFATTFSYEFPTSTWRDCAFAYLPTKEEDVFAYKIVQPHDTTLIPENKKMQCYC